MTPLARFLFALAGLALAVATGPARAADATRRSFDVPADDATVSLKRFAEQSGQGIVYAADAVRGTRTKGVKGELAPMEAIQRMLAGTELKLTQSQSGLLAVTKVTPAPE